MSADVLQEAAWVTLQSYGKTFRRTMKTILSCLEQPEMALRWKAATGRIVEWVLGSSA